MVTIKTTRIDQHQSETGDIHNKKNEIILVFFVIKNKMINFARRKKHFENIWHNYLTVCNDLRLQPHWLCRKKVLR